MIDYAAFHVRKARTGWEVVHRGRRLWLFRGRFAKGDARRRATLCTRIYRMGFFEALLRATAAVAAEKPTA